MTRGPFQLVVPSSVLPGWEQELRFLGAWHKEIVYAGLPEERRRLLKTILRSFGLCSIFYCQTFLVLPRTSLSGLSNHLRVTATVPLTRNNRLLCTLWEEYIAFLLRHLQKGTDKAIVVLIQFGCAKLFGGNLYLFHCYVNVF